MALDSLGALGVYIVGRPDVGGFFRLVRPRCECGPSVAAIVSMRGLCVLRDDEKFLRHVERAVGTSEWMEQGWTKRGS